MRETLMYFAYGSNLHPVRLGERVPSSELVDVGRLPGHRLRFHKRGRDGSGKCDAVRTGVADDVVWGAVFRLAAHERPQLDAAEGLGHEYHLHDTVVEGRTRRHTVFTYLAHPATLDDALRPYDWYHRLVLAGARLHEFPASYVEVIEAVDSHPDPDRDRAEQHRLLLERLRG